MTRSIRHPGTASTAGEASHDIRVGLHARNTKAVTLSISDLSPLAQMRALEKLSQQVDKKRADFAYRVHAMAY